MKKIVRADRLSVLDKFAMTALSGLLSGSREWTLIDQGAKEKVSSFDQYAEASYRLARAMMHARKQD